MAHDPPYTRVMCSLPSLPNHDTDATNPHPSAPHASVATKRPCPATTSAPTRDTARDDSPDASTPYPVTVAQRRNAATASRSSPAVRASSCAEAATCWVEAEVCSVEADTSSEAA